MYTNLNLQMLSSMVTQRGSVTSDAWGVGLLAPGSTLPLPRLFYPLLPGSRDGRELEDKFLFKASN